MANNSECFSTNSYSPEYHLGDRVRGTYNGIPFAGSVAIDTMVDPDEGSYIVVFLDLPIKLGTAFVNMIKVKHKDLIDVKGSYEFNRKTNRKRSVMGSN